jgi:hypothetical protein
MLRSALDKSSTRSHLGNTILCFLFFFRSCRWEKPGTHLIVPDICDDMTLLVRVLFFPLSLPIPLALRFIPTVHPPPPPPPPPKPAPHNLRTALHPALHRPTANRKANKADTRLRPVHRQDNSSSSSRSSSMARRHQVQVQVALVVVAQERVSCWGCCSSACRM